MRCGAQAALKQMAPALDRCRRSSRFTVNRAMHGVLNGHNYAKAAIDIAVA